MFEQLNGSEPAAPPRIGPQIRVNAGLLIVSTYIELMLALGGKAPLGTKKLPKLCPSEACIVDPRRDLFRFKFRQSNPETAAEQRWDRYPAPML